MEDKVIYVFYFSSNMSDYRKLNTESQNDILTIQIEWGREVVNLGSKESIQTLHHLMNYL